MNKELEYCPDVKFWVLITFFASSTITACICLLILKKIVSSVRNEEFMIRVRDLLYGVLSSMNKEMMDVTFTWMKNTGLIPEQSVFIGEIKYGTQEFKHPFPCNNMIEDKGYKIYGVDDEGNRSSIKYFFRLDIYCTACQINPSFTHYVIEKDGREIELEPNDKIIFSNIDRLFYSPLEISDKSL